VTSDLNKEQIGYTSFLFRSKLFALNRIIIHQAN